MTISDPIRFKDGTVPNTAPLTDAELAKAVEATRVAVSRSLAAHQPKRAEG